jgi:hypothetical protein
MAVSAVTRLSSKGWLIVYKILKDRKEEPWVMDVHTSLVDSMEGGGWSEILTGHITSTVKSQEGWRLHLALPKEYAT